MPGRDWLFAIGPLDESEAPEFRNHLHTRLGESLQVDLIDHRTWFSGAWDVSSIRAVLPVLKAGLDAEAWPPDLRNIVLGFLSDMETWLEREYDSFPEPDGDS